VKGYGGAKIALKGGGGGGRKGKGKRGKEEGGFKT